MNTPTTARTVIVAVLAVLLGACAGGSKMLKEPLPLVHEKALATQADDQLIASLDWVIVPGGPGTWAKNAYWDEYIIRVEANGALPVEIVEVGVVDLLATEHGPLPERNDLVAATKDTRKRFRKEGIKPIPGEGIDGVTVAVAGAGTYGALAGLASASLYSSLGATISAGTATGIAAAGVVVVGGPVLAVGSIIRSGRNRRVNREIAARQSSLPIGVNPGEPLQLNLFLPVTPAPQSVHIRYRVADDERTLTLPVSDVLGRLHLPADVPSADEDK
ncbi:MAG: hypothetical protein AAGC71_12775 [Pseudomonadota bacterium]